MAPVRKIISMRRMETSMREKSLDTVSFIGEDGHKKQNLTASRNLHISKKWDPNDSSLMSRYKPQSK